MCIRDRYQRRVRGGRTLGRCLLVWDDLQGLSAMRRKATKGKIITQKEFEILRNIFADQDTDESGVVDFQEFLRAFEVYPGGHNGPASILRRDTAACVFSQMDANNDGVMTFRELLMAYYPRCDAEYVDRIMSMYEPKTDAAT
eukprot:TRINITY_DN386_c0_g2_i18.p1 TRINITY_DN386_c0_g2~~TRINITY_DN386_c0_g2_i18.p1  ORF type:complete len:143 (+),score=30.97 TRINITY_DN386_c0_g2_i18:77-505(+)